MNTAQPVERGCVELHGHNTVFDLDLFLQLNQEYYGRPIIPAPRKENASYLLEHAEKRARQIDARVGLKGQRVLEVGCGGGEMAHVLGTQYGCQVTAIDVVTDDRWEEYRSDDVEFQELDLAAGYNLASGSFDRIVSLVVWEHVPHPFTMLQACHDLLTNEGRFYLRANLWRSAVASHRYREVYFPWPHLLFTDDVFEQFYEHLGIASDRPDWLNKPAWVNDVTYAQYLHYFDRLGFDVRHEWLSRRPLDAEFYHRFEDRLARYPVFDLTVDFFDVVLQKCSYIRNWCAIEDVTEKLHRCCFGLAERSPNPIESLDAINWILNSRDVMSRLGRFLLFRRSRAVKT